LAPDQALPKAKAAAIKALDLDHNLGEAHASLAFCFDVFDWNWTAAEQEFKRAIELSPGYATAHHWYAWHLSEMGRMNEALGEMRKAQALDPLSLIINADLAEELLIAHSYDESIQQSRRTIEMDPNFAVAHYDLGVALMQKQSYAEAMNELENAVKLSGGSPICKSTLACAYVLSGRKAQALKIQKELTQQSSVRSNAAEIALICIAMRQNDEAMRWLEKAYTGHFNPSILLRPGFDPLRSDVRFQNLLERIGLPR
jgi:tetratricopeptide (TPR) repeat protein